MKKIIVSILSLVFAVLCIFALNSCEEHKHSGEKWGGDTTHHWYVCDSCNSAFDTEEHDFEESMDGLNIVKTCKICNYSYVAENIPAHDHTYSEKFSYNDAFHYRTCTYEGCISQDEKAEHTFATPEIVQETGKITKTYSCQFCEYKKVETITVDDVIDDESAWNTAFDNLEFKNFQMTVSFKQDGVLANENKCIITDDGAYVDYGKSKIVYTKKNENGGFDLYVMYKPNGEESAEGIWRHYTDKDGEYYSSFIREAILQISYADNYNKFTYNSETGEYTCAENIECIAYLPNGAQYPGKMFCFNNVVKVADGKISHIECDYYFEGSEMLGRTQSFIYYNIGISEFEIPESVKSSAVESGDYNAEAGGM